MFFAISRFLHTNFGGYLASSPGLFLFFFFARVWFACSVPISTPAKLNDLHTKIN